MKILNLAKNDIKSRYSGSLFGIAWAFVMPLATILVFWYVFQLGFKNLPVGDAPYILWFSAAYIPWIFFTDATTSGCNALNEYSYLVKKVSFNVNTIPWIKLISSIGIHFFFIGFLLLMYWIYGYKFNVYNLQIVYYLICTCALSIGLIWLISAITVFFKDLNSLYNVLVQIGFWATPILWNEETMVDEHVRRILALNPLHYIVNGYRSCLFNNDWFWVDIKDAIYFWALTLLIMEAGYVVFRRLKPFFADEV